MNRVQYLFLFLFLPWLLPAQDIARSFNAASASCAPHACLGGLSFLPQAVRPAASSLPSAPDKPAYWTKRRVAVISLGLALAGGGAAMWVKGKDVANPNYNLNACGSALVSGGVGTGLNPVGDAAVGMYCNQTIPSNERKAGFVLMVVGGPVSLLGFLLHRH